MPTAGRDDPAAEPLDDESRLPMARPEPLAHRPVSDLIGTVIVQLAVGVWLIASALGLELGSEAGGIAGAALIAIVIVRLTGLLPGSWTGLLTLGVGVALVLAAVLVDLRFGEALSLGLMGGIVLTTALIDRAVAANATRAEGGARATTV